MKRILFFIALVFFTFSVKSQNSIKLYKVNLKANEILGNGRVWGPKAGNNKTVTFTSAANSLNELLGQTYSTANLYSTRNFLNTDIETRSPLLDSINFSYYLSFAFLKLEKKDPQLLSDATYKEFKAKFRTAKFNINRRELLFDENNRRFKNMLEESRYDTYSPPITVTNTTDINQKIKMGVSAEIVADIKKIFTLEPKLALALEDSISRHIEMKNAKYHEIKLAEDYVKIAASILKGITPTSNVKDEIKSEGFYEDYISYFKSKNEGIITGAAVIEAMFDAEKLKTLQSTIGLTIKGKLKTTPEKEQEILSASADITAKYVGEKNIKVTVTTVPTFYYLRYVYDSRLDELGIK